MYKFIFSIVFSQLKSGLISIPVNSKGKSTEINVSTQSSNVPSVNGNNELNLTEEILKDKSKKNLMFLL